MNGLPLSVVCRIATRSLIAMMILSVAPGTGWGAKPTAERSAYDYMLEAHNARTVWNDFPGFTANVAVKSNSDSHTGTIVVNQDFEYTLKIDDEAREPWVKSKLRSVISVSFR